MVEIHRHMNLGKVVVGDLRVDNGHSSRAPIKFEPFEIGSKCNHPARRGFLYLKG